MWKDVSWETLTVSGFTFVEVVLTDFLGLKV